MTKTKTPTEPFLNLEESIERVPTWRRTKTSGTRTLKDVLEGTDLEQLEAEHQTQEELANKFHEAYEEGLKKGESTINAIQDLYQTAVMELCTLRKEILDHTEKDLITLALEISKQILDADVETKQDFTMRMVSHSLHILREADFITLRIGSSDLSQIKQKLPDIVDNQNIKLIEDKSIAFGGAIAECNLGRVDATLEQRLFEAAQALKNASTSKQNSEEE